MGFEIAILSVSRPVFFFRPFMSAQMMKPIMARTAAPIPVPMPAMAAWDNPGEEGAPAAADEVALGAVSEVRDDEAWGVEEGVAVAVIEGEIPGVLEGLESTWEVEVGVGVGIGGAASEVVVLLTTGPAGGGDDDDDCVGDAAGAAAPDGVGLTNSWP